MSENAACAHLRVMYRTETDGQGFTRGWWECEDCPAHFVPESSLAQARADVEALRRVDQTAEALILSIGYPKNRLLVARYTSAKAGLPEHLRGAREQEAWKHPMTMREIVESEEQEDAGLAEDR